MISLKTDAWLFAKASVFVAAAAAIFLGLLPHLFPSATELWRMSWFGIVAWRVTEYYKARVRSYLYDKQQLSTFVATHLYSDDAKAQLTAVRHLAVIAGDQFGIPTLFSFFRSLPPHHVFHWRAWWECNSARIEWDPKLRRYVDSDVAKVFKHMTQSRNS